MKLPAALEGIASRFDQLTLRERLFVSGALLVALLVLWDTALMQPLAADKRRLEQQLAEATEAINAAAATLQEGAALDPVTAALARQKELQAQLANIDMELEAASAGFIPPEMMVQVVRDVLAKQSGLKLISLRNGEVTSLVPAADGRTLADAPYVHPVDIVIEGSYLSVLDYLRALEALPWRFYWKNLELEAVEYPVNRVHIEISTLSMERDWLGV